MATAPTELGKLRPQSVTLDDLIALSLSDAFRKLVLEDPQVVARGRELVAQQPHWAVIFEDGQHPGPIVAYDWPLDISEDDLAYEFVHEIIYFPGSPVRQPSREMREVARALVRKLQALREWLVGGHLVAWGTFERTGAFAAIHRQQWGRSGIEIDVRNGDRVERIDNKRIVQWSGLVLEGPGSLVSGGAATQSHQRGGRNDDAAVDEFHVKSTEHAGSRLNALTCGSLDEPAHRSTPLQASVGAAIAALWPDGIPAGLPIQMRDRKIIEWQKTAGLAIASSKTIGRYLKRKA